VTTFNYIDQILFGKKVKQADTADNDFSLYMVQRWLSMSSPHMSLLMNRTCNKYYDTLQDKDVAVKFLDVMVPKTKTTRLNYIKKVAKTKQKIKEDQEFLSFLAKTTEMSKRELRDIMKMYPALQKKLKKDVEIFRKKHEN
jgi:hypothetical protein